MSIMCGGPIHHAARVPNKNYTILVGRAKLYIELRTDFGCLVVLAVQEEIDPRFEIAL